MDDNERAREEGLKVPFFVMGLAVICFILLFAGIGMVSADTYYYISPSGNNSNNGTSLNSAWATLSHAQGQLTAGDTLLIVNGAYYNDTFVAQVSGNATHPITIKAYNGTPTFHENGSGRTLELFKFHDWGYPGPIHNYDISGIKVENYSAAFEIWRDSNSISIDNIQTSDCYMSVHLLRSCTNIAMSNFTVVNSYHSPFHFWYDNHHNTLDNATITGTIYGHGVIDFHTNNDNFTITNVSFTGNMNAGEAIYFHGDYGTNDNNTFYDIVINATIPAGITTNEIMDLWEMGYNNYFENLTVGYADTNGDSSAIVLCKEGSNWTMKNVTITNAGQHAIYFTSGSEGTGDVVLENITFINSKVRDINIDHGERIDSLTFRNLYGDNNNIVIRESDFYGLCNNFTIEYTDGTVFSTTYTKSDPRYYPDKNNISVEELGEDTITYYPMTAVPISGDATVAVDKFDTSLPKGEFLVNFTANTTDGNNVVFRIGDLKPNYNYLIKRDGADFTTAQADTDGYIQFSNSEWSASARTFTIEESSEPTTGTISGTVTNSTSGTPISEAIVTAGSYVSITNMTGGYILSDLPEGNYTVTASADGYKASSVENVTVTADETATVNFLLNASYEKAPTTTYTLTPPPDETGWNNATPVVVTFFRSASNGSIVKYTNYSKMSETGPWTTVNTAAATGPDAVNVTDISEEKFNLTVSDEGVTTIWYYSVNNNATSETIKNVTVKIDTTTTPPSTISNLQSTTSTTWINWMWTNPLDDDFSHVMVYLNGIWETNTSDSYYNATDLAADTSYELSTHTVDTHGNVNTTWVNQTAATLVVPNNPPNTPGNPYPSIHAPDQSIVNTDLSWSGSDPDDGDTVTYDVYFGTSTNPSLVSTDQTGTIYDPGTLSYDTTYYWKIAATDNHGASTTGPLWDFTTGSAPNGAVSGTITSTNDRTGVSGVTVNLTLNSTGTVIATTTTDSSGDYLMTDQAPGEYTLTASKIRFWSDSMSVTVNFDETVTANCALWLKGDLNNNGISADAGDRAMMKDASVGKITPDWKYDLNTNGLFADAGDRAMMKDASVGKIELL